MESERYTLIGKKVDLPNGLIADAIYVSTRGNVLLVAEKYSPKFGALSLDTEYLEAICSRFYYGGRCHCHAIADIALLNGALSISDYDTFYAALRASTENGNLTVISSQTA